MSDDMRPYVVRQGDYLVKLAWIHGFDVDEVWGHEKNKALADLRKDHHILAPGDVLYIPVKKEEGLPIQKGTTNKYVAKVPKVGINACFREHDGTPWTNEPCLVYGVGGATDIDKPYETTLDKDGVLTLTVPVHVREIQVVFWNKNHLEFNLRIGDMDPPDVASGAEKRLRNLGFGDPDAEAGEGPSRQEPGAWIWFQLAHSLTPTGVLDEATQSALAKEHGY